MNKYLILFLIIIVIFIIFLNVDFNKIEKKPINLTKNHICSSDDMIIINYNGPKAQILWKDGSRSFYCEVREAFYESLDKFKKKFILAFYVQDFSNLQWGSYIDKWVLADTAYYVIDSSKDGAMGISYIPFSDLNCAKLFFNSYGGKLLKFNEINLAILNLSSELLKDRIIN